MKYLNFALSCSLFLAVGCGGNGGGNSPSGTLGGARNTLGLGPAAVSLSKSGGALAPGDLGSAGSYAILSKTGISTSGATMITGHIGVSPAAESYVTGFTITDASPVTHATAAEVAIPYMVYAADMVSPTPSNLTTAVGSMQTAYTDAMGRINPDFLEYMSGNLSGLTLAPGLYKWTGNVTIPTDLTISGSATDIWIFQVALSVDIYAGKRILLGGQAKAENIYWVVAENMDMLANSHFEGILLVKKAVNFGTGATMNGRIYSQTDVNLLGNTIVQKP
ncbi:MAG TPA: ice-binding family protein [Bacteriovoracaceae bacterium]|nr:ice-binding family protein [Bacteriovoracaceae bacterium]